MFLHVELTGGQVRTGHTGVFVLERTINILHETKECASTIWSNSSRFQAAIYVLKLSILKTFRPDFLGWVLELGAMECANQT